MATSEEPTASHWTVGGPPFIDPTTATKEAVEAVKQDFHRDLKGAKRQLSTRMDALDATMIMRWQGHDHDIDTLKELIGERFTEVTIRFDERARRVAQQAEAGKEAIASALTAAKELNEQQAQASREAAAKSEASFTKQLDSMNVVISTQDKAQTDRLTELKERIDRGEGGAHGASQAEANMRAASSARQNAIMVALFGFSGLLGAIGIIISLVHK